MRHLLLASTLVLFPVWFAVVAADEEPPKLNAPDDARVKELTQELVRLRKDADFATAVKVCEEIERIHTRAYGADHWQPKIDRCAVDMMRHLATHPLEGRKEAAQLWVHLDKAAKFTEKGQFAQAEPEFREALRLQRKYVNDTGHIAMAIGSHLGFVLQDLGKLDEAFKLHEEMLTIHRKLLGDNHPRTGTCHNNMGVVLMIMGRHEDADPHLTKALSIRTAALGPDHFGTGESYSNAAANLIYMGKHAAAEQLQRKALPIYLKHFGPDAVEIAPLYGNLASSLQDQDKHAESEPFARKALAIFRAQRGDDHPDTLTAFNNLGSCLRQQGKIGQAEPIARHVLASALKTLGDKHPNTGVFSLNLGMNLLNQRKVDEAELYLRQALDIFRKVLGDDHWYVGQAHKNLAVCLYDQEKSALALEQLQKALAVIRKTKGEDHALTLSAQGSIAVLLSDLGRDAEGLELMKKTTALRERHLGKQHPDTALAWNNLAGMYVEAGDFAQAADLGRTALVNLRQSLGEYHPLTTYALSNHALVLQLQGQAAEATAAWRTAVASHEVARLRVGGKGLDRVSFGTHFNPLFGLALHLAYQGDAVGAFQTVERSLARGLLDELSDQSKSDLPAGDTQRLDDLNRRLDRMDDHISSLLKETGERKSGYEELAKERSATEEELARLAADLAARDSWPLERIQAALPADGALVAWVDMHGPKSMARRFGQHWVCVVRARGEPQWFRLPGSAANGLWTEKDQSACATLRRALARPESDAWRDQANRIYQQLFAPLEPALKARDQLPTVRQLIVLPSPALAGVPLEAVTTVRADSLPKLTISYAPSGTIFAQLQDKGRMRTATAPRSLLALGDPVFQSPDSGKGPRNSQRTAFADLPGTRREIEAISPLFSKSRRLLGSDASQQELETLAKAGKLREFTVLHFATHGLMNSRTPLNSALILAQDRLPDAVALAAAGQTPIDGKLTAQHIRAHWKLDADLVTLSACETGLGLQGGSEGYLGFSQPLFLAGARSLIVSQWQVSDTATALLMTRFYQNWLGKRLHLDKPMPKAEALREAKEWLRNLTHAEIGDVIAHLPEAARGLKLEGEPNAKPQAATDKPFAHPYYWSAFILIGDPN